MRVFVSTRPTMCGDCGHRLAPRAWIILTKEKGTLCLACADLTHLALVPRDEERLGTVARKYSTLTAELYQWNVYRKRHERKGYLVEVSALERAEEECLPDDDAALRRERRELEWRKRTDNVFISEFAHLVRACYPACPQGVEFKIAASACLEYGGPTGRVFPADGPDEITVRLAVISYVRLTLTTYGELLSSGYERWQARDAVDHTVNDIIADWEQASVRC